MHYVIGFGSSRFLTPSYYFTLVNRDLSGLDHSHVSKRTRLKCYTGMNEFFQRSVPKFNTSYKTNQERRAAYSQKLEHY